MICERIKLALDRLVPPVSLQSLKCRVRVRRKGPKGKNTCNLQQNGVVERDYAVHGYHLDAHTLHRAILEAVSILDEAEFFLETIPGVDWIADNQLEVVYDFSRYDFDLCRVVLRTRIDRKAPVVPTITTIYPGANWHERETHDFFGITFEGHPHLIPLLLPEDADFHPLLKDFKA
jgi:NADH-quinone oxidoreductase subunit C